MNAKQAAAAKRAAKRNRNSRKANRTTRNRAKGGTLDMKIPVIVFDAHKRKYIQVGEHSNEGNSVTVLEEYGKVIAKMFGEEYRKIKPDDYYADGRVVRKYNIYSAIASASFNFQPQKLLNIPEPVSIEENPIACVTPPMQFFPDEESFCWCVPGFVGDNERSADADLHRSELALILQVMMDDSLPALEQVKA